MKMTSEQIWNSVFGPNTTPATVLAEASAQGVNPQDYAMSCIGEAVGQGFTGQVDDAYACLCHQLGVPPV